jgi:hypothetical protein
VCYNERKREESGVEGVRDGIEREALMFAIDSSDESFDRRIFSTCSCLVVWFEDSSNSRGSTHHEASKSSASSTQAPLPHLQASQRHSCLQTSHSSRHDPSKSCGVEISSILLVEDAS